MKATELMIGDWVKFPIGNEKICDLPYIEGKGICASFSASATLFPVEIEKLKPIPLTPEILEKNGFKDISTPTLKGYDTFRLDLKQRGFEYCITVRLKHYFRLRSYDEGWYTLCEMEFGCNYVHELQHALRLCGINIEIKV